MQIQQHRSGLRHVAQALQRGEITLGFIGGSITDSRAGWNWPEPVIAWFVERFPGLRVRVENGAIGATSSDLAVFRAEEALIAPGCDLVFVEYAVNDGSLSVERRRRTQEGLLRKLLAGQGRDVVLVYTYAQSMYADMVAERMPPTIRELEELGVHYQLPSVWMSLHALREVMAGRLRWEEWLPDGLHPQSRGSLSYAQSVIAYLERELFSSSTPGGIPCGAERPAPLDPLHWEAGTPLPLDQARLQGPWTLRRWYSNPFMPYVLDTAAVGARLSFYFQGRALALGFDFGGNSAEFRYRLDEADWVTVSRDRPVWCGPTGWYRLQQIAEDLPAERHAFEMEVIHGDREECHGTDLRLGLIGVVP